MCVCEGRWRMDIRLGSYHVALSLACRLRRAGCRGSARLLRAGVRRLGACVAASANAASAALAVGNAAFQIKSKKKVCVLMID